MRRIFRIAAVAAVFALAGVTHAAAGTAVGFYFDGATGIGQMDFESKNNTDTDMFSKGLGVVFDTNLNGEKAMGWRIGAGFESYTLELDNGGDVDVDGLTVTGVMAFPLKKSGNVRLWLGPEAKFGFYSGNFSGYTGSNVDLYTGGIGGRFGANIFPNPEGKFAISVSIGLRADGHYAQHDNHDDTDEGLGWNGVGSLNLALLWN